MNSLIMLHCMRSGLESLSQSYLIRGSGYKMPETGLESMPSRCGGRVMVRSILFISLPAFRYSHVFCYSRLICIDISLSPTRPKWR